ncbi:hypothetical protein H8A99_19130 [Bradyrhizobium sp. Arg68]|uniref:hypothetical protein n=1 Tax=Bradyrhizobium ivorense TaxID=2511166 RepID=UPI001E4D59A0|nr:hypothetical protein [Bradyrhizobium ivorense]MCC8938527.1 hypothetical protein [Bradyrhizobium ivorense]
MLGPNVESYRSFDRRELIKVALNALERYTPSDTAREDYLSAYAYETMGYVREYPQQPSELRDLLPKIETPVNVVSGANDIVVPRINASWLSAPQFQARLDRRGPLHLGGRGGSVCGRDRLLVGPPLAADGSRVAA